MTQTPAARLAKFPPVADALAYSRNYAKANPNLTKTAVEHIEGLAEMLDCTHQLLCQAQALQQGSQAVARVFHKPHRPRSSGRDDVLVEVEIFQPAPPHGTLLYLASSVTEASDEMIEAACDAVPGLLRVDAMRAVEAALSIMQKPCAAEGTGE